MKGRKRPAAQTDENQLFTWTEKEHSYFFDHFISAEMLLRLLDTAASGEAIYGLNNYTLDALQVSEACKAVLREFTIMGQMLDEVRPPLLEE